VAGEIVKEIYEIGSVLERFYTSEEVNSNPEESLSPIRSEIGITRSKIYDN
jgi:hypothetical protein